MNEKKLKEEVSIKVDGILETLIDQFKGQCNEFPSLMTSLSSGLLLLGCFYEQYKQNDNFSKIKRLLLQTMNNQIFSKKTSGLTLCNGLIGTAFLLHFLKKNKMIALEAEEFFSVMDKVSYDFSLQAINKGNYDYLHGGIGGIYYLLDRLDKKENKKRIINLLKLLKKQSTITSQGIAWREGNAGANYNLGMAHGIGSLIVLFSKAKVLIDEEISDELLRGSVDFILNNKIDNDSSVFPNCIEDTILQEGNKLAWCYGDLGLSSALLQAARALSSETLKSESISTCLKTFSRHKPTKIQIKDACICHGTSGIMHIYNRMFADTKITEFKQASTTWAIETLKKGKPEKGMIAYRFYEGNEIWTNNSYLLEGTPGIGLAMLSYLSPKHSWDKFFLLS